MLYNFKNIFCILTVILLTVSCELNNANEGDYVGTNPRSGWVEFENESTQVLRTDDVASIPVELNVDINDIDTQIEYTVEVISDNPPEVSTGNFTTSVRAGDLETQITYDLDPTILSPYTLQFTITNTSNPDVIVGLEGDNPIIHTLEVCPDVLPLAYTGVAFIGDSQINMFDVVLTRTGDCSVYEMNSAWGTNFVAEATGDPSFDGQFIYPANLTLNADLSLSITGVGDNANLLPGSVSDEDSTNGNSFDFDSGVITYTLSQGLFGSPFVVDVILTPAVDE